jgi:enamine deaminase RidA (YjgF/YER057c/UK114 family)
VPTFRPTAWSGPTLFIAGLVGREHDGSPCPELDRQVTRTVERLGELLASEGLTPRDLVRVRVYLTDVSHWSTLVLPRLAALVDDVMPPATVVGVAALVEPWMAVEIDAEASRSPAA